MNPISTLIRASADLHTAGRTLEGLAFRWDHPSMVRDPGTAPYFEEFHRASVTKTLRDRASWPLFAMHKHDTMPLGIVSFQRSEEGLVFTAPLSKTIAADEALELVNDGALRSVSVGFKDFKSRYRASAEGPVTVRMEIGLREMSLAPTGFGQHAGAEVLAVRSEIEGTPKLDANRKRASLLVVTW